jgi:hypothetical protein
LFLDCVLGIYQLRLYLLNVVWQMPMIKFYARTTAKHNWELPNFMSQSLPIVRIFVTLILLFSPVSVSTADNNYSVGETLESSEFFESLDIDGNGEADALTDGLLLLRYMFGLGEEALVNGVLAPNASFTVSDEIQSRISALGIDLDIDSSGEVDALTDGLIILRYLFGLRGEVLVNGVTASNAQRSVAGDIESYLDELNVINYPLDIVSSSHFIIPENQMTIGTVVVTAPRGSTVSYELRGWEVEFYGLTISNTGEIRFGTVSPDVADYERRTKYSFEVEVTDGVDTVQQGILLTITDVDESIDGVDYQAEPLDDPEHIPSVYYARHCKFYDNVTGEIRQLSEAGLTDEELLATYSHNQKVVIPDSNYPVEILCAADWDLALTTYSAAWTGQERADLGIYGYSSFSRITQDLPVKPIGQAGIWGQWMQPKNSHPYSAISTIEGGLFSDDKMGRSYYPKYMASGATHFYNPNSSIFGWGFYEARVPCDYYGAVQIANTMVLPPNLISFDEQQDAHTDNGGMFFGHAWMALPFIGGKERSDWANKGGNDDVSVDLGKLSWTFFAEAKNFSGPVYAYVPEMWYRRLDRWNSYEVMPLIDGDDSGIDKSHKSWESIKGFLAGRVTREELMEVITAQYWYADGTDNYVYDRDDIHYWARAKDTLAFTPAAGISVGAERDATPVFKETDENGDTYIKTFIPPMPSANNIEPFSLSSRSYGVESYNHFFSFFKGQSPITSLETNLNAFSYPLEIDGLEGVDKALPGQIKAPSDVGVSRLTFDIGMTTKSETVNRGSNIYYDWGDTKDRGYSEYYKVIMADLPANYQFFKTTEDSVPLRLKALTHGNMENTYSMMPHVKTPTDTRLEQVMKINTKELFGYESEPLDFSCWVCDEENGCDPTINITTMDDGSIVKFRWYRFKNQPTFAQLIVDYPEIYTEDYLNSLQSRVEDIHENWINKDTDFLSKPDTANGQNVNLVELDHGHIVTPPAGKEKGWVPIVISVEMPYGKWIDNLHLRSFDGTNLVKGY